MASPEGRSVRAVDNHGRSLLGRQARAILRSDSADGRRLDVVVGIGSVREVSLPRFYSHSIVAGGLLDMSYTTRLMPRTSLMMRTDTRDSRPCGSSAQCAVMKSEVS